MNKHIELVKKWLANPESVSQQELSDNRAAAAAATCATNAANADATYWVKRYEEVTK